MFDYVEVTKADLKAEIDAAVNCINDKLVQVHHVSVTSDHLSVKVDFVTERTFDYLEDTIAYLDGVSKGIDFGQFRD